MAARALTAAAVAGRRVAGGRAGPPLLAPWRSGEAYRNHFSASAQAQREEEDHKDVHGAATTREQVQAALNCKNVEVLQGEEHVATVLPGEAIDIRGAGAGGDDASWVPDQETGVFGPADPDDIAATNGPSAAAAAATMPTEGGSVLDQAVFVREEEMQDVERPAMANTNASNNKSSY